MERGVVAANQGGGKANWKETMEIRSEKNYRKIRKFEGKEAMEIRRKFSLRIRKLKVTKGNEKGGCCCQPGRGGKLVVYSHRRPWK